MKRLLFTLGFVTLFTISANSQTICETSSYSPNKDLLLNTYKHADYMPYSFCVTIYVHVIRKGNYTGGQSVSDVNEAMGYLDDAYNPYNIFFDWDGNINYINNTFIFENPAYWTTLSDNSDGVDIYLFDDSVNHPISEQGYGQSEGVGFSSKLMVTGSFGENNEYPLVRSHVLSHEMGHVFNLWHTHHGTVTETGDPDQCPEYVSGSNSDICGDYITDTPADPNMEFNVDVTTCEWLGYRGVQYYPDELNILSYTHPYCMEYITYEQARRAKTAMVFVDHLQLVSTFTHYGNPCDPTSLNFYPNSSDNELNLDLRNKPNNLYTYFLYDSVGIEVLSGESQNVLESLDTSGLDEGVYFLHFYDSGVLIIRQIVVTH